MTAALAIPERRFLPRLRPIREIFGTNVSWTRIEPGPSRTRTLAAVAMYATTAICIATMLGWFVALADQTIRWQNLRSRGVTATATVVDARFRTGSDGGYYLDAHVATCDCVVTVKVTTINVHLWGSLIPVRYDPRDHSNAVPLVDRPSSHLAIGWAAFIAVFIPCAVVAGSWLRTRRRCKTFVRRSPEARPVTFEAWKRSLGNTHHFLVLYDSGASRRGDPICCVPVPWTCLRRLRSDDVLWLYGHGGRRSVVLRRARRIILPCGPAKPGRWEQAKRVYERL